MCDSERDPHIEIMLSIIQNGNYMGLNAQEIKVELDLYELDVGIKSVESEDD